MLNTNREHQGQFLLKHLDGLLTLGFLKQIKTYRFACCIQAVFVPDGREPKINIAAFCPTIQRQTYRANALSTPHHLYHIT